MAALANESTDAANIQKLTAEANALLAQARRSQGIIAYDASTSQPASQLITNGSRVRSVRVVNLDQRTNVVQIAEMKRLVSMLIRLRRWSDLAIN